MRALRAAGVKLELKRAANGKPGWHLKAPHSPYEYGHGPTIREAIDAARAAAATGGEG